MTENEKNLDMLVANLNYENRLLRARNDRLMREAEATNFDRTAAWLKACGKPVLLPGGKIGKGPNYKAPEMEKFV